MGGVAIRFVVALCCFGEERMGLRERRAVKGHVSLVFEYTGCTNGLFYSTESWYRFRQIKPGFRLG